MTESTEPDVTPPDGPPDEYMEFARAAFEHRECRARAEVLIGDRLHVTAIPQPLQRPGLTCPHGVSYWLVPAASAKDVDGA